MMHKMYQHSLA